MNKTLIRNFLTIRYNPLDKPLIKPATLKDFQTKTADPDGIISENVLLKSVSKLFPSGKNPLTVSLSSGIDSTLCLGLLRKTYPKRKIIAICGVFEDAHDESKRAKLIAEKFEADFKILYMDSLFTSMPEIIFVSKKPRWNTYQHLVAKEAKKYSDMLATGDGADEIFGGYTFRYEKFLTLSKPHDDWNRKILNYLECHNRDWVPDQHKIFGSAIKFDWNEIYTYFKPFFHNSLEPIHQIMLADFNGKLLHDFIPTGKAISTHYGTKYSSMFLDRDVISFGLQLPIEQKYDSKNKVGKIVLRKISKRLGINHIDEKKGFSPSLLFDWQKHGKDICTSFILDKKSRIFQSKLINYDWIVKAFERVENDGDVRYLNRLISILALEIWYRIFITKELKPSTRL